MASSSDSEDDSFMAVDPEEAVVEGTMEQDEEPRADLEVEEPRHNRSMLELPEEVLEYILSFLSPYQEHKTAALVCKQWYRLIKGTNSCSESAFLVMVGTWICVPAALSFALDSPVVFHLNSETLFQQSVSKQLALLIPSLKHCW